MLFPLGKCMCRHPHTKCVLCFARIAPVLYVRETFSPTERCTMAKTSTDKERHRLGSETAGFPAAWWTEQMMRTACSQVSLLKQEQRNIRCSSRNVPAMASHSPSVTTISVTLAGMVWHPKSIHPPPGGSNRCHTLFSSSRALMRFEIHAWLGDNLMAAPRSSSCSITSVSGRTHG